MLFLNRVFYERVGLGRQISNLPALLCAPYYPNDDIDGYVHKQRQAARQGKDEAHPFRLLLVRSVVVVESVDSTPRRGDRFQPRLAIPLEPRVVLELVFRKRRW